MLIQKAISFLVTNFNTTGNNPKPVILHSIRVAMYLYDMGEEANVIVAALLHDLLEDTKTTSEEIKTAFSDEVANLVEANSFKSEITDYVQKYMDTFERTISCGKNATLIKAADLLDNADYYTMGQPATWAKLLEKLSKFVEMSESIIGDTRVWHDLRVKEHALEDLIKP